MSKASDGANAVVNATIQICGMYGVSVLRMQSRVVMVPGAAGRIRPMFFGRWTDEFGNEHNSGMADLLARPRVAVDRITGWGENAGQRVTLPLWIECKAGKGKITPEQAAFKHYVESNGEHYVLISNDVRPLMRWLDEHGVKK